MTLTLQLAEPDRLGPCRAEPRVWVKRLTILRRPGVRIREIDFHTGVNVVAASSEGTSTTSGHGCGKTLLCHLLRFVLGEDAFARRKFDRRKLRSELPQGYVSARVVVLGQEWRMERPFSEAGMSRAAQVTNDGSGERMSEAGYRAYLDALQASLGGAAELTDSPQMWFSALRWMARDQGRLKSALKWRFRSDERRSRNVARALLRLPFPPNASLVEPASGAGVTSALQRRLQHLEATVSRLEGLRRPSDPEVFQLEVSVEVERAQLDRRLEQLSSCAHAVEPPEEATSLELKASAIEDELAELRKQKTDLQLVLERHVWTLEHTRAEAKDTDRQRVALTGSDKACPTCSRPWPQHAESSHGQELDRRAQELKHELEVGLAAISKVRREFDHLEVILSDRAKTSVDLRQQQAQHWLVYHQSVYRLGEEAERARVRLRLLDDLGEARAERHRVAAELAEIEHALAASAEEPDAIAEWQLPPQQIWDHETAAQHATLQQALSEVTVVLLGPEGEARLESLNDTLSPRFSVDGQHEAESHALQNVSALAFDLAVLRATISDKTDLPGLWIHDGPRDSEISHKTYGAYIALLLDLDQRFAPAFQYILTTSDEVTGELAKRTVDSLGSRSTSQLLLRLRFGRDFSGPSRGR